MPAPPAKKSKECSTISMVVGKGACFSPITHIKGYPWRLRIRKRDKGYWKLFVRCEKSMEAELWNCEALVGFDDTYQVTLKFDSADKKSREQNVCMCVREGTRVNVKIAPADDGSKWRSRPIVGIFDPRDEILLIEDKKMYVNKQSLASQSPYFERLFNGDFKEKNMSEIPIGDVSAEEFTNLIKMTYGENGGSVVNDLLTRENVHRVLELADRFDLKIVRDGVLNSLLSSSSRFSIHERLLIAEQHDLTMCKDRIISQYTEDDLMKLNEFPEVNSLSGDTMRALFKKSCDALSKVHSRAFYEAIEASSSP